jgi:polar amino acid transport system substrate-binding protein
MKKLLTILFLSLQLFADDLVVGTTSGYAPFVSLNPQGKYEGFDIDIAELVAQKLGRKLVLKDLGSMPSLMLALKQKKVDVLIWAISITKERQKNLDMVYYQGDKVVKMPFLFWDKAPAIESMEELAKDPKKVICVEAGSFQEEALKKVPGISLKYIDKITDAVMEIKMGKSFATLIDPSLVAKFKTQYPNIRVLNLPLPPSSQSLGNGICINKTNTKLSAEVRKAIDELTTEGKIAELEKKWGLR